MNQQSLKFLLLPILLGLVVWWWWPSSSSPSVATENQSQENARQSLVSAIQPINNADALTGEIRLPERTTRAETWQPNSQDRKEFSDATAAIQDGDTATAIKILNGIVSRQPGMLEPYINLASAHATSGNLEAARKTLMQGLNANENYGALFTNLQRVHAALAADAYQLALADIESENESQTQKALQLPLVTALNAPVVPQNETRLAKFKADIQKLESTLAKKAEELDQSNTQLAARTQDLVKVQKQLKIAESAAQLSNDTSNTSSSKIASLENRLSAAQQQISSLLSRHETELATLQEELALQKKSLAEQSLLADEQLARQKELREQEVARLEQQRVALRKVEAERLEALESQAKAAQATQSTTANNLAIERVKSWAQAWSDQNVDEYINHYRDNYVPLGSSISHQTWLDQRQVRLTNKRFIEVTLSDFETELKANEMIVTFTQRYRANTMDDTIKKQLTLRSNSGDWSRAKIVAERVLR